MPFYEYECRACGAQTEVLQKISDKPLRKCEECGKSSLVKLVSAPIFRLKGGGWYETDFKSEQDRKRNLAGDGEEKPKSESKSPDAKPEANKSEPGKSETSKSEASKSEAAKDSASKPKAKPVKTAAKSSRVKPRKAK